MPDVKVTGFAMADSARASKRRWPLILGWFNCIARGIELRGCALVRYRSGALSVRPPRFNAGESSRSIRIVDDRLHATMLDAAVATFTGLGGEIIGARPPGVPTPG